VGWLVAWPFLEHSSISSDMDSKRFPSAISISGDLIVLVFPGLLGEGDRLDAVEDQWAGVVLGLVWRIGAKRRWLLR